MAKKSNKKKSAGKKKASQQQQKRSQAVSAETASVDDGANGQVMTEVGDASVDDAGVSVEAGSEAGERMGAGDQVSAALDVVDMSVEEKLHQREQEQKDSNKEQELPMAVETVNIEPIEHQSVSEGQFVTVEDAQATCFTTSEDDLQAADVEVDQVQTNELADPQAHHLIQQQQHEFSAGTLEAEEEIAAAEEKQEAYHLPDEHAAEPIDAEVFRHEEHETFADGFSQESDTLQAPSVQHDPSRNQNETGDENNDTFSGDVEILSISDEPKHIFQTHSPLEPACTNETISENYTAPTPNFENTVSRAQFSAENQQTAMAPELNDLNTEHYISDNDTSFAPQTAQIESFNTSPKTKNENLVEYSVSSTPVLNDDSFKVEETPHDEGEDAEYKTQQPIEVVEPLSMSSTQQTQHRENEPQTEKHEQSSQGTGMFAENDATKGERLFDQINGNDTVTDDFLSGELANQKKPVTVDASASQTEQNIINRNIPDFLLDEQQVDESSNGFLSNNEFIQETDNGFWNSHSELEEENELPWNNAENEKISCDTSNNAQESIKFGESDSLDINDSLLPITEEDSFFSNLNTETQKAKNEEPANTKTNNDAKFAFMEEDDIMLDDIMDDDLLDDEDEEEAGVSFNYSSNKSADNTIVYNPASPLANQNSQLRTSSVYLPNPITSSFNQNDVSLPPGIKSVLSATKSTFNSTASALHQKLEEEKKKSDAYDFPADLITKHKKKTPQATFNVYTKLEANIAHHEKPLDLKEPPKIGRNDYLQPKSPSMLPVSTSSQKNSRSSSVTKKDSFFAEMPVSVNKTNSSVPVHLKNPYDAIEKNNIPGNVPVVPNVPNSSKRKNPYAPPSNTSITPSSIPQSNNLPVQSAKNPYSAPETPSAGQSQSIVPPMTNVSRLQPPHLSGRQKQRSASGSKKTNPYAPTDVGGHARTASMDPTPIDINPNLVAIPTVTPITPSSPINNLGQHVPSQFPQAANQYMPQTYTSQLSSPVNQFVPSIAGTINQGFAFPSVSNKYAPTSNAQPQHANITGLRRSTKVGRQSISSINEVYGPNIVTSSATSTAYRKKSVLPPGPQSKGRNSSANNVSIAPAPVVINPENLNRRHWPLFSFSTDKFLSMVPSPNGYGVENCNFQIQSLKDVIPDDNCSSSFPGPLSKNRTKRKDLIKWLEFKIASVRNGNNIGRLSINEEELLWSALKFMAFHINNKDEFVSNKEYHNVIINLLNPDLSEFNEEGNVFDIVSIRNIAMSINPSSHPNAHRVDPQTLSTVHLLLEKGDKASALSLVLSKGDWSMALLIANLMGPQAFNQILNLYTTINYGENDMSSDLSFFLQADALHGLSSDSLLGKESWIAEHYTTIIPFILKNSSKSTVTLCQIGESLMKTGHKLYGKIAILLSGEPLVPTCNEMLPTSIDDMIADEIYEYILLSSGNMPAQFIHGLPHMLPVKIRHAGYLVDFGFLAEAKKYCDATQGEISSKQLYVETSTKIAQNRLSESLSQLNSNWLGGKISRPQLDKVWTTLDKSFNKFVSGEENVEKKKVEEGIFSKFISPSVSRIGSQLDLTQPNHANQNLPALTTVNSLPSVPNGFGNQINPSPSANSTPKRLGSNVGHFANFNNPPISNSISQIAPASMVPPARANNTSIYAAKALPVVADVKSKKYAPSPVLDSQKNIIENSKVTTNIASPSLASNTGSMKQEYATTFSKSEKYSPNIINSNLYERNELVSAKNVRVYETKNTPSISSVMETLPDKQIVPPKLKAQKSMNFNPYAPPAQPYKASTQYGSLVSLNNQLIDDNVSTLQSKETVTLNDHTFEKNKPVDRLHVASQLETAESAISQAHNLSQPDYVNEKGNVGVDIANEYQPVADQLKPNVEQEKNCEDSYDEDLDETTNFGESPENGAENLNEELVKNEQVSLSIPQQPVLSVYGSSISTEAPGKEAVLPIAREEGGLKNSNEPVPERDTNDSNFAYQTSEIFDNVNSSSLKDEQNTQNIEDLSGQAFQVTESEFDTENDTESLISATSPPPSMPKVKPEINRYAPSGSRPVRKAANPYANPNAMRSNAKKGESIYAPKVSSEKAADDENYDPLAAMGITGNVSSMDMFTVGGYHIPPPETVNKTSESYEKPQIKGPEVSEESVEQVPVQVNNDPIPMMHMPSANAPHLTNMFNPPSAPLSVTFEGQKSSPIYTITEQKKFYAEDTGEFYDDVIEDDDDDYETDESKRKAEQERLAKEERSRKEKEEIELKKRKEEEESKKKELAKERSGSWFGSFFSGSTAKDQKKVYKAKLGEENSFYYDEKLKRWINKKASVEEQIESSKPPPPPPVKSATQTPSNNTSVAPTPPPGSSFVGLSNNPPVIGNVNGASNKLMNSSKGGTIDDLLNRPSATTRKGKRGPRRGYVDVMAQQ